MHSQATRARNTAVAFPKRPVKPWLVYSPQDPRFLLKHEICFNWHGSELSVSQRSLRETEFLWLTVSTFVTTTVGQRLGAASAAWNQIYKSKIRAGPVSPAPAAASTLSYSKFESVCCLGVGVYRWHWMCRDKAECFPGGSVVKNPQVRSLIQKDSTCCRATKPMRHSYWACALKPRSHGYWAHVLQLLKPTCPRAGALQ